MQHERQRDREAEELHGQLHDVHHGGRQQTAGREIRGDNPGAEHAAGDLRHADHDGEDPRDADQLAGENRDRPIQRSMATVARTRRS